MVLFNVSLWYLLQQRTITIWYYIKFENIKLSRDIWCVLNHIFDVAYDIVDSEVGW